MNAITRRVFIDKQATALSIGVGKVVTTKTYDQGDLVGCRLRPMFRVPDARKVLSGFAPYGNHVVMVYRDHRESL